MSTWMDARVHVRAMTTMAFVVLATGCPGPSVSEEDSDPTGSSGGDDAWFEIGWGITEFNAIEDGSELEIVWGSQGAAMFPMPVRGGGFVLPEDPSDYESPLAPKLDLHIDIEGHNNDVGGHFRYLANYPIVFEVLPDDSYEFLYVAVLMPDGLDPAMLEGLPARVWTRLRPYDAEPMEVELDVVVRVGATPR